MRVIAGKARRIQLKTVPGMDTRPTTDRIKETLFNILQTELYRACFLDLFSGSGAIGIEALSRGCEMAVFVENNRDAVNCIREKKVLNRLSGSPLVHADTVIIVEASLETDFSYIEGYGFTVVREKNYKTNKHIFLKIK